MLAVGLIRNCPRLCGHDASWGPWPPIWSQTLLKRIQKAKQLSTPKPHTGWVFTDTEGLMKKKEVQFYPPGKTDPWSEHALSWWLCCIEKIWKRAVGLQDKKRLSILSSYFFMPIFLSSWTPTTLLRLVFPMRLHGKALEFKCNGPRCFGICFAQKLGLHSVSVTFPHIFPSTVSRTGGKGVSPFFFKSKAKWKCW